MKVYCYTFKEWTKTIAAFVREGITFSAEINEDKWPCYTIELTGGY